MRIPLGLFGSSLCGRRPGVRQSGLTAQLCFVEALGALEKVFALSFHFSELVIVRSTRL